MTESYGAYGLTLSLVSLGQLFLQGIQLEIPLDFLRIFGTNLMSNTLKGYPIEPVAKIADCEI